MLDLKNISETVATHFKGLDLRDPSRWPLVPRAAAGLAVIVLILVLGWMFFWSTELSNLSAAQQKELKLRDEFKIKHQQAISLDMLKKKKEQVLDYVSSLEKQLPNKSEMDALLSDINRAGTNRGLQFELFAPGQVVVKDFYAELPINIKVTGRYHDIGGFASDIAALPRIVTFHNLNLNENKNGLLTLEVQAKTYRYLDPEEVQLKRVAAAPDRKGAQK